MAMTASRSLPGHFILSFCRLTILSMVVMIHLWYLEDFATVEHISLEFVPLALARVFEYDPSFATVVLTINAQSQLTHFSNCCELATYFRV